MILIQHTGCLDPLSRYQRENNKDHMVNQFEDSMLAKLDWKRRRIENRGKFIVEYKKIDKVAELRRVIENLGREKARKERELALLLKK